MTEPTPDTPEPVDLDAPANTEDTDDHPHRRNREGEYRKRARAAEVELTLARARIAELNRAEAERQAVQRIQDSSDLWAAGIELDHLLGGDGMVDASKVDQAVGELLARKPHLGRRGPLTPPASNVTGDGKRPGGDDAPTWESAFGPGGG